MIAAESIIKPKAPKTEGWVFCGSPPPELTQGYPCQAWYYPAAGIMVLSAVKVARDANDIEKGPEYHVSVSARISQADAQKVLAAFDMEGAEEDNHVPYGFVRNFWKPVNEGLIGHTCPCKEEEPAIREDKGDFVWRPAP